MSFPLVISRYILWHYSLAFGDLFRTWKTFLWFLFNFFSVWTLVRTLFAPWKRLGEKKGSVLEPKTFFTGLVVNTVVRLAGFFIRSVTLFVAAISILFVFVFGLVMFVAWFFLPFLIITAFFAGIRLLL